MEARIFFISTKIYENIRLVKLTLLFIWMCYSYMYKNRRFYCWVWSGKHAESHTSKVLQIFVRSTTKEVEESLFFNYYLMVRKSQKWKLGYLVTCVTIFHTTEADKNDMWFLYPKSFTYASFHSRSYVKSCNICGKNSFPSTFYYHVGESANDSISYDF